MHQLNMNNKHLFYMLPCGLELTCKKSISSTPARGGGDALE
jgi:hypothetical protein